MKCNQCLIVNSKYYVHFSTLYVTDRDLKSSNETLHKYVLFLIVSCLALILYVLTLFTFHSFFCVFMFFLYDY